MKNKTICFLQLTRFGDLIQTYQAAKSLLNKHPQIKLILVSRKQFSDPLNFLLKTVFSEIITVDFNNIFSDRSDFNITRNIVKNLLLRINSFDIDVLLNVSYSKSSNYLASLIKAKHKLGTRYSNEGIVEVCDQWSQHVFGNVMRGPYSPFNLVDIMKRQLGLELASTKSSSQTASNIVKEKRIAIHPFASNSKKHWPTRKWRELLFKILKDNKDVSISIFGSKSDQQNANDLTSDPLLLTFKSRITSYVGKTSIEESYNLLSEHSHFIGHDSMVGHLAKIAKLPTLTIALGTVRPIETVPYGENSFVLSPKTKCFPCFPSDSCQFFQCHSDISYQAASSIVSEFVNNTEHFSFEKVKESTSVFHLNGFNLGRSEFTNTGMIKLKQLDNNDKTSSEIFKEMLRVVWLYKFSEAEEANRLPTLSQTSFNELLSIAQSVQYLFELAEFGKKYSKDILIELAKESPSLELIKSQSLKIDEIDRLQELVTKTQPILSSIVDYFTVLKTNLQGETIVKMAENSYIVYSDYAVICSALFDLLTKTLSDHKLKSNKTAVSATR